MVSRTPESPVDRVAGRGRPRKTFKACRNCRRQKIRCDGTSPCAWCNSLGTTCDYGFVEPKRPSHEIPAQEGIRRKGLGALESKVSDLRNQLPVYQSSNDLPIDKTLNRSVTEQHFQGQNSQQRDHDQSQRQRIATAQATDPYSLNPDDLDAPVTAVHAMSREIPRDRGGSIQHSASPEMIDNEADARHHFNCFMTSSNCFLPILDPVFDTFDSIRSRSLFCLYVILEIASRSTEDIHVSENTRQMYSTEARRLAAETLFIGKPTLEDAQAMALLAAYSERTWLAIGHAIQMALLLNLKEALPTLLRKSNTQPPTDRHQYRNLWVQAKTWLGILCIEWEIAAGTARQPRLDPVNMETLREFALLPAANPSDFRIVYMVELVMLRRQFQQKIEGLESISDVNMTQVRDINEEFDSCWSYWDGIIADNEYPKESFQRTSLCIARGYARIFMGCTLIRKIQLLSSEESLVFPDESEPKSPAGEIFSWIVRVVFDQLSSLAQSSAYTWHLRSAPTYNVLTLAFTCAFALKASRAKPNLIEDLRLCTLVETAANALQTHPHQNYYRAIRLLLSLPNEKQMMPLDDRPAANMEGQDLHPQRDLSGLDTSKHPPIGQDSRFTSCLPDQSVDTHVGSFSSSLKVPTFPRIANYHGNIESSWIFDGRSIGSFALPENGDASVFDFEFPANIPTMNH